MGFYGPELLTQQKQPEITNEEFNQIFVESLISVIESYDNDDYQDLLTEASTLVQEGANMDIWKKYREATKEIKEDLKAAKKAIKAQDKQEAKSKLNSARKSLVDCEKFVKELDTDVDSAIFGYFATALLNVVEIFVPMCITATGSTISGIGAFKAADAMSNAFFDTSLDSLNSALRSAASGAATATVGNVISSVGAVITIIKGAIILIRDIKQLIGNFDDAKNKNSTADKLNLFKNRILIYLRQFGKMIDKFEAQIK